MSIAKIGSGGPSSSTPTAASLGEDFPIICEKCLGPNPYVRMLKSDKGKQCKISGSPFSAFRWQGEHKRWKETCISPAVAREKNVCQACVCDLEYGIPFHVRDHVMEVCCWLSLFLPCFRLRGPLACLYGAQLPTRHS